MPGSKSACIAPALHRCHAWAALFSLFSVTVYASSAFAQVNLITVNPAAAQPGTAVAIGGSGFPSGAIPAANVSVIVTPPDGGGVAVTAAAGAVVGTGSARLIVFTVPAALAVSSPMTCSVTVGGSSGSGVQFATSGPGSLVVQPPAFVRSVAPGGAQAGGPRVALQVSGENTHFTTNTTVTLTLAQSTIRQTGATTLTDATHVSAMFDVPGGAPAGAYAVTATTGTESAALAGGLLITSSGPPALSSVDPGVLAAGQAATVNVTGVATHFVQGGSVAGFGDGVMAGPVTVVDATHASIPVAVDPLAAPGARPLTLTTGEEYASGAFTVASSGGALASVGRSLPAPACANECSGPQGTNATLSLTGTSTHWVQGPTAVSVGGGIAVGGVVVNGPTSLSANISIGLGVPVGSYPVKVSTGGETVTQANAFAVTAAAASLSWVYPNTGAQGQTIAVSFTGVATSFDGGSLTANFGPDVTVNSTTADAAYSATANITIAPTAFTGSLRATLSSNGTAYGFTFTIMPSNAGLVSATPTTPATVHQNDSGDLIGIVGSGTHFTAAGATPRIAFCAGVSVAVQQVVDATHIIATIDVSANAPVGACGISVTTGGEVASGLALFSILAQADAGPPPATPESVVSVSPANHQRGVPLNALISLRLVRPANPLPVDNSSVTLTPAVTGSSVHLSPDGMTITVALGSSLLTAGQTYLINVPAGAFQDVNGNPVAAFASKFDTGAATDAAIGAVTLTSPAPGQQNVAVTQAITVAFSKPWNPNSLTGDYFKVCRNQDCNYRIAGTVVPALNNAMVFMPAAALPANTRIDIYVGCDSGIQDLAGSVFNPLNDAYFVTGNQALVAANAALIRTNTADSTPWEVSIAPANGAADVGIYAPIATRFNRRSQNGIFAINVSGVGSPSVSADGRSVTIATH